MVGSNLQNGPLLNVYHQDSSDMCPHVFTGRDLNILHINSGHVGAYGRDVFSFRLVMISARFLGLYVAASATLRLSCSCRLFIARRRGIVPFWDATRQMLQMRWPDGTGRAVEADPTEIDPPKSASF